MLDYSLYLVTDNPLCQPRTLEYVVEQAALGGVTVVQLRDKQASTSELLQTGERLKKILDAHTIPLLINDRLDVALALDAAGVHLGQTDMPYPIVRKLLGPDKIIGVSISSVADLEKARHWEVDYFGVGPIFPTLTKTDAAPPLGLAGLKQIRRQTSTPLIAIGGIQIEQAANVLQAGANGIAVVSAICTAPSPQLAAQQLRRITHAIY